MGLRADVWALDGGLCVGCGKTLARNADGWQWSVHHCIKAQVLRRRGLRGRGPTGRSVCVLVCRRCHERHENRTAPIPSERLPERIHYAVGILGPWAQDLLARYHPPDGASSA